MKPILSTNDYQSRIKTILITEEEIQEEIKKVAVKIDTVYDGRPILLVGILKGSFVFMADVCRHVSVPCEVAFMRVQSYFESTVSSGSVKVIMDLGKDVSKYHCGWTIV